MAGCIARGVAAVETEQAKLRPLVEDLREVASTHDPTTGKCDGREAEFHKIRERLSRSELPMRQTMAATMMAFAPGLFVVGDDPDCRGVRRHLTRVLHDWMRRTGDPLLDGPMAQGAYLERMKAFKEEAAASDHGPAWPAAGAPKGA